MKKISMYISTLFLICQFSIDAMDEARKRGREEIFEDQFSQERLFPVPMDLDGDKEPWGNPTFQTGFVSNAQTDTDSLEEETKKRKQTVLTALKDLMDEARTNPTLLDPYAIEDIVYKHFLELKEEERYILIEAGLDYLLSEPTSAGDPLLNCKILSIVMNESFHKNPLILDFAKRVSAFWGSLQAEAREKRNAVALFFLTDDQELMAIADGELFSEWFLQNSTIWPCEIALDALLQKGHKDIARAFIRRVMALPENQGKDFRGTGIIEQAERIDPSLSSLLEEFSALGIKDKETDGG